MFSLTHFSGVKIIGTQRRPEEHGQRTEAGRDSAGRRGKTASDCHTPLGPLGQVTDLCLSVSRCAVRIKELSLFPGLPGSGAAKVGMGGPCAQLRDMSGGVLLPESSVAGQ